MPLDIINASYIYNRGMPQEHMALNDISLSISDNAFTAVIGHTGSGKSTLMQLMNGLLKPETGRILINKQDINSKEISKKTVRQMVGLVFQYPEHQLFEETVLKDVAFGPRNLGLSEEEVNSRVINALKLVGLDNEAFFEASPFTLSGGEKRRVAIAGVLAMEPEFLILDEPTAGLDPNGRDEIMQAIAELQKYRKISVVLVTHSMEEVAKYASEVHVLHEGKLVLSGKPIEVFAQHQILMEAGLKLPSAAEITSLLRAKGINIPLVLNIKDAASVISKTWRTKNA